MLALKTQVRTVLLNDSTISAQLPLAPSGLSKTVYLNHIASVDADQLRFPAISLFMHGGPDDKLLFARELVLQVDVWTPDARPSAAGLAYGLTGASNLYERCRTLLHMAHQRRIMSTADFSVSWCAVLPGRESEGEAPFEEAMRLHHWFGKFRVNLIPTGADLIAPNA